MVEAEIKKAALIATFCGVGRTTPHFIRLFVIYPNMIKHPEIPVFNGIYKNQKNKEK